jgi:Fe-S-cluster containining protein
LKEIPKDLEAHIPVPFRVEKVFVLVEGACKHLKMEGGNAVCDIYETRPDVCRRFQCEWHFIPSKEGKRYNN